MEITFTLLDEPKKGWVPEKIIWVNFHLTKHFIVSFTDEGYDQFTSKDKNEITSIMKKQQEKFSCKVKQKFQAVDTACKECDYRAECNELISDLIEDYFSLINNALTKDVVKPRHAFCFDVKRKIDTLYIVSENGTIVVSTSKKYKSENYRVKTCYREQHHLHPSFKVLANDDNHWNRLNAIKMLDAKLNNRQLYRSVDKVLMENWKNA